MICKICEEEVDDSKIDLNDKICDNCKKLQKELCEVYFRRKKVILPPKKYLKQKVI